MSTVFVKLQRKGQMVIPRSLREGAGISEGTLLVELGQVISELRQESKAKGLDTMSMKEINRAVAAARRDMKKTSKQAAK